MPLGSIQTATGSPWGILALALGIVASIGIPVFDTVMQVPGYAQSSIINTGMAAGALAVGAGIRSIFFPAQRRRGFVGAFLGLGAVLLLPTLLRA